MKKIIATLASFTIVLLACNTALDLASPSSFPNSIVPQKKK
jgi:hypothetical protein